MTLWPAIIALGIVTVATYLAAAVVAVYLHRQRLIPGVRRGNE